MGVKIITAQRKMTAYLDGELDHHAAAGVRDALDDAILLHQPQVLTLDFDGVTFMDSSGVGLVMGRWRTLSLSGGQLIVRGLSPQHYKIMQMSGLDRIASIRQRGSSDENQK